MREKRYPPVIVTRVTDAASYEREFKSSDAGSPGDDVVAEGRVPGPFWRVYVGRRLDAEGFGLLSASVRSMHDAEIIEVVGLTVVGVEDAATLLGLAWSLKDIGS